jgi:hypothetical protein
VTTTADSPEDAPTVTPAHRSFSWQRCTPLATVLVLTTAAWLALFVQHVRAHQPNTDDYFYSYLAHEIADGSVGVLHTGQTSPLVPTLAAPLVQNFGVDGGIFVQLPLLLLLVVGAYLLVRTWIRPIPAAVTALAVGINQAAIGYAVMFHFSIAVTGAIIWAFYSYVRSDHLREPRWCVALGVALAALLLSRSMTPAYALPLLVVVFIDVVLDARRRRPRWATILVPAAVVIVVAGPWWLVSGHTALQYLSTAGYDTSTGFSARTGGVNPSSVFVHITWALGELGWPQSIALGVAVLASLWGVARYRSQLNYAALWLLPVWVLFTVLVLSSSGDNGSGFPLPVVTMTVLTCGAILGQFLGSSLRRPWTSITLVVLGAVLLAGLFAVGTGGTSLWWNGPAYRTEVLFAGGSRDTNLDALAARVHHIIGSEPTIAALNSPLLNVNGLTWTARQGGLHLIGVPNSAQGTKDAIASVPRAKFIISGSSSVQFPPPVDERSLALAAEAHNFRPIRRWIFGTGTALVLWKYNPVPLPSDSFAPSAVRVLKPAPGAVWSGNQYLLAGATSPAGIPARVTKMEFFVSGNGLHDVSLGDGFGFDYGWLGSWKTTQVPNGRYIVTSVAVTGSRSVRSPGVAVQIKNP